MIEKMSALTLLREALEGKAYQLSHLAERCAALSDKTIAKELRDLSAQIQYAEQMVQEAFKAIEDGSAGETVLKTAGLSEFLSRD